MRVDLHNHTPLCKHAVDEPREYVLSAINSNCEYFGFSDHAPMKFDEAYRMEFWVTLGSYGIFANGRL